MIKDNIDNARIYMNLSESIKIGLNWIINNDLDKLEDGKYIINDDLYANIQTYKTKDDALFEAHRDYIDIQYMISGNEKCGVCNYKLCNTAVEYNKEKDIEFLSSNETDYYSLKEREFFIFFPNDAHKPSIKDVESEIVKKVVVKVHI